MFIANQHHYPTNVRTQLISHLSLHGLWGIYLGDLFRRIATNLVGLFIPIYIWQQTGKLIYVPLYYLIYSVSGMIFNYPGALLIKRLGTDWSIALGTCFRALFIFLLIFAQHNYLYFWLSALCFGLAQPFDWLPYYYVIAKLSRQKKLFGKAAGASVIVAQVGTALGPVIGGIIIETLGFNVLYVVSGSLLVLAALLPFLDEFDASGMHVSGKELIERFQDEGIRKHLFANGLHMFDLMASTVIWPIFLYTAVKSFESSGVLQTLSLLVTVIVSFIVGKQVDKQDFKLMNVGDDSGCFGMVGKISNRNSFRFVRC